MSQWMLRPCQPTELADFGNDDMTHDQRIPDGVVLMRTTDVFTEGSAPAGLLRAHRVAAGVWGRLVVSAGSLVFVFEDELENARTVTAGDAMVIPPSRPHHVELTGPVEFAVEFYRRPDEADGDRHV